MPRLPTLLTTLFALSVILTPVLAVGLEPGFYKITHTTIDNKTVFLDSEYGDGEGIQLNLPRTEKNNGQLWFMDWLNDRVSLENVKHQCGFQAHDATSVAPTIICGHHQEIDLLVADSGKANTWNVVFPDIRLMSIMASNCLNINNPEKPCNNVTLTTRQVRPERELEFTFIRQPDPEGW
ncbi:hypothetical protein RSOLAG1IB_12066 [Rhizoctonia solani AG-1 IB]|uniref:Ricin B lectin domain-containing protein n=1 Tax=Thanatephorus cucumeris (strain AG1-IB / isolate 7/3/14) TaxID=1108050 RepID=M5C5C4_THACB|nr:hypothetical protein BN14_08375 [Rhizoctonia solani AG-1 IB]CEL57090.1 hypothetical protein RSOLAG1IB_12066 [Rhizoctonia solani AG-1 IB]